MQHFDNPEQGRNDFADSSHYTEEDFDYILYQPSSKKPYLDPELKQFYFVYEDYHGYEHELFTTINCVWEVVLPDPTTWASDIDFYGYSELTAWKVISVENAQGDAINPEDVLTDKQLEDYNAAMSNFIEE